MTETKPVSETLQFEKIPKALVNAVVTEPVKHRSSPSLQNTNLSAPYT